MKHKALGFFAAFLLSMLLCLPAFAANFASATVSAHQTYMVIHTTAGSYNAPTIPGQVGFASPAVSSDGHYIGWLALYPNLSYPVPVDLMVMDENGNLQKFESDALIFEWCFLPSSKSVAFMSSSLHFTDGEEYEWWSLPDHVQLDTYVYPDDYRIKPELRANDERAKAIKNAPAWVKCVPKSPIDEDN
ncbi:MAG: hypothetical protein ACRETO_11240 [Gammaproteobacteria bacterium]